MASAASIAEITRMVSHGLRNGINTPRRGRRRAGGSMALVPHNPKFGPFKAARGRRRRKRQIRKGLGNIPMGQVLQKMGMVSLIRNKGDDVTATAERAINTLVPQSARNGGFGSVAGMGQAVFGNKILAGSNNGLRMQGKAHVGVVNLATDGNQIVFRHKCNPGAFPNSWVAKQAALWERYKFRGLTYVFTPAMPSTVAATFAAMIDTDARDTEVSGSNALQMTQSMLGNQGAVMITSSGGSVTLPTTKRNQWFYNGTVALGDESRLIDQGLLTMVQTTKLANFNAEVSDDAKETPVFNVIAMYDIEFDTVQQDVLNTDGGDGLEPGNPIENARIASGVFGWYDDTNGAIEAHDGFPGSVILITVPENTSVLLAATPGMRYWDALQTNSTGGSVIWDNNTVTAIAKYHNVVTGAESVVPLSAGLAYAGADARTGSVAGWTYFQNQPDEHTIEIRIAVGATLDWPESGEVLSGFSYQLVASKDVTVEEFNGGAGYEGCTGAWSESLVPIDGPTLFKLPEPVRAKNVKDLSAVPEVSAPTPMVDKDPANLEKYLWTDDSSDTEAESSEPSGSGVSKKLSTVCEE